ncbi:biotin transporter BioY [Nitrolancea hollandica]|uniref:Biotin transporter n=1 Tax=Nitrolancea hollandica Lb TaxID=1129897 RepID=I4ECT1_9BACT|nr:biotin transporter BioY [Nitrolancea hollandica]CCF82493.1 BioY protein [Nitrolancea hollandica Lb]
MATAIFAPRRTIIDAILQGRGLVYQIALIVAGSLLVALSAQITIPLPYVPLTGQTYAVLLVGALLGSRRAGLSMLLYLLGGQIGLPFFARSGGPPTMGYIFGFILAGFIVGWLAERGWDRNFKTAVAAMAVGEAAIFLLGLPWLAMFVGWSTAFAAGLLPFILGDLVKLLLAAATLPLGWRLVGGRGPKYGRGSMAQE